MSSITPPTGWNVSESLEPGPQTGETDSHSRFVDPNGPYGATDSSTPNVSSYKADNQDRYNPEGSEPRTVAQPTCEENEQVQEDGVINDRQYFLIFNTESQMFHVYIPELEPNQPYTGPKKSNRADALEAAFKVLNLRLPTCALAQLRERFPETIL